MSKKKKKPPKQFRSDLEYWSPKCCATFYLTPRTYLTSHLCVRRPVQVCSDRGRWGRRHLQRRGLWEGGAGLPALRRRLCGAGRGRCLPLILREGHWPLLVSMRCGHTCTLWTNRSRGRRRRANTSAPPKRVEAGDRTGGGKEGRQGTGRGMQDRHAERPIGWGCRYKRGRAVAGWRGRVQGSCLTFTVQQSFFISKQKAWDRTEWEESVWWNNEQHWNKDRGRERGGRVSSSQHTHRFNQTVINRSRFGSPCARSEVQGKFGCFSLC